MKMMHMYITLGVLLVALIAAVVMVVVERRRHERCTEGPVYSCASKDNFRTCFGSNPPKSYEEACKKPLGPVSPYPKK